ncbi:MAG: acyl carrier protein [Rubrivivax sp.]|nr:acyl carrier protein [Rubrivivax sp.]
MTPDSLDRFDPAHVAALRGFFQQHVPAAAQQVLSADTALLGTGLLDSLAVIQLMVFLGETLGVEIGDEDFTPENLDTLGHLLAFIQRKSAA